jgi:hypothetical protein
MKRKKEKKINFRPNHVEPPNTRHLERKRMSRQIKYAMELRLQTSALATRVAKR